MVFDGDYASWTSGCSDAALGKAMDEATMAVLVSKPRVMRDMPRLMRQVGLQRVETLPFVYLDIGRARSSPALRGPSRRSWRGPACCQRPTSIVGSPTSHRNSNTKRSSPPATITPISPVRHVASISARLSTHEVDGQLRLPD